MKQPHTELTWGPRRSSTSRMACAPCLWLASPVTIATPVPTSCLTGCYIRFTERPCGRVRRVLGDKASVGAPGDSAPEVNSRIVQCEDTPRRTGSWYKTVRRKSGGAGVCGRRFTWGDIGSFGSRCQCPRASHHFNQRCTRHIGHGGGEQARREIHTTYCRQFHAIARTLHRTPTSSANRATAVSI